MRIGTREIGPEFPPYIIAELGVNHDGDPARALELVHLAAGAGADAIKLQLFRADLLMSKAAKLAAYQKAAGETDPIEMLRRLELSIDDMAPCVQLAHELGIHAIVSVFSVELVPIAETLPWDAYKTASPDIINKPLLDALAATGKPLIISTGASTLDEVTRAVEWLKPIHDRLAVLQCVSSYPTPESEMEIGGILAIAAVFPGAIGYSDHSMAHRSGVPVAAGAFLLEKHFTYDRHAHGPDHTASLIPWMMMRYCEEARRVAKSLPAVVPRDIESLFERIRGVHPSSDEAIAMDAAFMAARYAPVKRVLPIEQDVRTASRQSLTTTCDLPAGHILTRSDLTIKRPGTGIPPYELDATLGRRLARAIEADLPLTQQDLQ